MTHALAMRCGAMLAAVALALSGCADEEPTVSDALDAVVDDVAQALGTWTPLYTPPLGATPVFVGVVTGFKQSVSGCHVLTVVSTQTGQPQTTPALPGCPSISAGADLVGIRIFVADAVSSTIYSFQGFGGGVAGNGTPPPWTTLVTGASGVTAMRATTSHLYWQDSGAIRRVAYLTGAQSLVASNRTLLGADSSFVYAQSQSGANYSLVKIPVAGGTETVLYTGTKSLQGFGVFNDSMYWTEDTPGGTNRLMKVVKSTGASSIVASSMTFAFRAPTVNSSWLFWVEQPVSGAAPTFRQTSLTAPGTTFSAPFPMLVPTRMLASTTAVFAVGLAAELQYSLQSIAL